ncbi:MAG: class I SAM-dependent methyltransferase [Bacteroidota bacterium]
MKDIFGRALLDYQSGNYTEDLITYSSLGEQDILSLPYLFRNYEQMPFLEKKALDLCYGKILDIGCGAGGHSLYLQDKGFHVTGLDRSLGAVATCKKRGLLQCIHGNILDHKEKYDTLLLMMNGIGIAGRLRDLDTYLHHFKSLLNPGGHLLLDSSDIIYMFRENGESRISLPKDTDYYGEVQFKMMYKGAYSNPFPWLYVDFQTLEGIAKTYNLEGRLVSKGGHYDYLARLVVI